ncbi:hypothetical protein BVG79_01354 [Ketogulonicigenium robustum]|uniref:Uncharacterized protein n=1 Tax=Ketogulonicigenium robustum TaxID=92947 RepID=A0A1W6P046_9RHOB|nr:hypothetical protein BVG79_01354 [Ketogulonicigenium robustum]
MGQIILRARNVTRTMADFAHLMAPACKQRATVGRNFAYKLGTNPKNTAIRKVICPTANLRGKASGG